MKGMSTLARPQCTAGGGMPQKVCKLLLISTLAVSHLSVAHECSLQLRAPRRRAEIDRSSRRLAQGVALERQMRHRERESHQVAPLHTLPVAGNLSHTQREQVVLYWRGCFARTTRGVRAAPVSRGSPEGLIELASRMPILFCVKSSKLSSRGNNRRHTASATCARARCVPQSVRGWPHQCEQSTSQQAQYRPAAQSSVVARLQRDMFVAREVFVGSVPSSAPGVQTSLNAAAAHQRRGAFAARRACSPRAAVRN